MRAIARIQSGLMIEAFLQRCDSYCARRGISRARLSTLIFNDGKKLRLLDEGKDIGVQTLQRASITLAALESEAFEPAGGAD